MKNIHFHLCLILGLLITLGCATEEVKRTIKWEEDKLVEVLFDLRIMDNQIKKHHILDRDSVSEMYSDLIYRIHNISEEDLTYHLEVLQKDAKLARSIEDKVLKKMVERKKIYEKDDDYF